MEIQANTVIHNRFDIKVIDAKSGDVKRTAQAYNIILDQLFSHKLLRYMVGCFQIILLILNVLLISRSSIFVFVLLGQVVFYLITLICYFLKLEKLPGIFRSIYYFNLLNLASIKAFMQFFLGKKQVTWTPRKGS